MLSLLTMAVIMALAVLIAWLLFRHAEPLEPGAGHPDADRHRDGDGHPDHPAAGHRYRIADHRPVPERDAVAGAA